MSSGSLLVQPDPWESDVSALHCMLVSLTLFLVYILVSTHVDGLAAVPTKSRSLSWTLTGVRFSQTIPALIG